MLYVLDKLASKTKVKSAYLYSGMENVKSIPMKA